MISMVICISMLRTEWYFAVNFVFTVPLKKELSVFFRRVYFNDSRGNFYIFMLYGMVICS